VRIERRTVAAAIFHGEQLEFTDSRQLSSDNGRALASSVAFVRWLIHRFPVESVAIEPVPAGESQRRILHDGISEALRNEALPIWEVPQAALLEGYGHPAPRSRAALRQIAVSIWPVLAGTHAKMFIQDAAVLGLHVQIERLFIINDL